MPLMQKHNCAVKPRLHDTTCCHTGCQTGGCQTRCTTGCMCKRGLKAYLLG